MLTRNRRAAARFCEPSHSLENCSELYPNLHSDEFAKAFSVLYIVPAYGNVVLMLLAKTLLT